MSKSAYSRLSHFARERDLYRCLGCGVDTRSCYWWSIQHRQARGTGGQNELENMITLCGSATSRGCHLKCEQRDPEMHRRGLWLYSWEDPATTHVILPDGRAVILTPDGRYADTDTPDLPATAPF